MSSLKFKTRDMQNPRGRARVYFCCHPEDFDAFFEEVSNDILKYQNCAVWYRNESDPYDEEEHLSYLAEMQLFVMPVTTRLLCTKNRALDTEFRFAVEHHIPVLPLMQEAGLDKLFNERCGDIQYLDRNNTDDTAISYDEKLEKYLSGILIGDELAAKIRAAFDAYVFLSYRKKDRKYAQELMRLIHKNEFCRDIAIWYDEFLTPGENFNDAIREALEKSDLFVLAVTPSLVEELNYIMTTEYPMAREAGKPILPFQLVKTGLFKLRSKYKKLPAVTDAHDEAAVSKTLFEAIKRLAIRENDNSPEHNFFIGLAYRDGIDVEVDYERALSLISGAAEAGLLEACEQLVQMYRQGKCVRRDYREAIRWQEKKIEIMRAVFDSEKDMYQGSDLLWEMLYCGDYYKEIGNHEKALETYIAAMEFGKELCDLFGTVSAADDLSKCYARIGDIYSKDGNLSLARTYYEESLKIREQVMSSYEDDGSKRSLAVGYERLGDLCKKE
ncbi:MAG: toll/interleukin-1 receptor domain-containing protein [Clostridia bacterium]|nr:toll/interleukin-1 receptor domain-containing protein [Clostridia bacterium]